jgi:hypothetical protein
MMRRSGARAVEHRVEADKRSVFGPLAPFGRQGDGLSVALAA